jgi:hypothetical protein
MTVPYTFGTATTSIPLSNLDANFNTPITLGNTSIYLGNTTTTIGNLTLTNVTISSGTANITSNITYTTANAVVYTNSSSVGITSSALTFNGTTLTANTIGAFTLGGTIAGGGNQINNVIIGTTTPLAGSFTTLSATGVATFSAGTVSLPAITTTGDTNTGIYFPAADTIAFTEGGAESMRITSAGIVDIGGTSGGSVGELLVVEGANSAGHRAARINNTGTTNGYSTLWMGSANDGLIRGGSTAGSFTDQLLLLTSGSIPISFYTANTERMRISSTGSVGIGTSSPTSKLHVVGGETRGVGTGFFYSGYRADGTTRQFYLGGSDTEFYINVDQAVPMILTTSGTERMRIDSTGVIGIGITTAGSNAGVFSQLQIGGTSTANSRTILYGQKNASAGGIISNGYYDASNNLVYSQTYGVSQLYLNNGTFIFSYAASGTAGTNVTVTEAMRLDASGKVQIGQTTPYTTDSYLTVANTNTGNMGLAINNQYNGASASAQIVLGAYGGDWFIRGGSNTNNSGALQFLRNTTNVMNIDSSGRLLVGLSSNSASANGSIFQVSSSPATWCSYFENSQATAGNCFGLQIKYQNAAPNGTGNEMIYCVDNTALRMAVRSNGGIANYSANDVNLSDKRTKTDIENAGGYLAKICAIPVRTFKYKNQTDDLLNLGVIAQEVEAVAPELVDVTGFGETPEDGIPLKAIYQTDLQYALMKALQELKAEFDAYKSTHP